jgi:hypothetical protein
MKNKLPTFKGHSVRGTAVFGSENSNYAKAIQATFSIHNCMMEYIFLPKMTLMV